MRFVCWPAAVSPETAVPEDRCVWEPDGVLVDGWDAGVCKASGFWDVEGAWGRVAGDDDCADSWEARNMAARIAADARYPNEKECRAVDRL